jgi:hypothetical protein
MPAFGNGDDGALPHAPLENFLKKVFKTFKNFYIWVRGTVLFCVYGLRGTVFFA